MRTTDPEPRPYQPVGKKVEPAAPAPAPEWRSLTDSPGFEQNAQGQLRTTNRKD